MSAALGLLLLRCFLALLLLGHATQKLFGWFSGRGLRETGAIFESTGLRPGVPLVLLAGATELAAGALFLAGFLTPLAAAMTIGAMAVAIGSLWEKGLWGHLGGYEVALSYAIIAAVLAMTGPGALSLDAVLGWQVLSGPGPAALAVLLGLAGTLPFLAQLRRARHP